MENVRILIDKTPEGIFYCEESDMQKAMRLNNSENDTFGKNSKFWGEWYKVDKLEEITEWLDGV